MTKIALQASVMMPGGGVDGVGVSLFGISGWVGWAEPFFFFFLRKRGEESDREFHRRCDRDLRNPALEISGDDVLLSCNH